ncbi:MAG: SpoIID/LytB domain-containing protein [Chloroflexi bacterium]|nr:MAG: SpoIID/LytB domain-containing protein [Chloroflexota bacterium]
MKRRTLLGHLATCVVIAASTLSVSEPVGAVTLAAVPATVRVNVSLYGISYALIGSTGAMIATTEDGTVLYKGGQRIVARTNVQRVEGEPVTLPPPHEGMTSEERASRLELLRDARRAAREAQVSGKLVTIPFEVSLLAGSDDALGTPVLTATRVGVIRFVADFGYLNFAGRLFRGVLEVTTDDSGDMIVVNQVETSRYLASVTGAESPSSWNGEALAAQAIAARTYLVTHLHKHGTYDLEGDTRDQEYGGIGTEADSANALPYLRSVPSPGDELAKDSGWGKTSWEWNREFTAPQLGDYLRSRGINVGVPQRIELVRVTSAGRVTLARVVGTAGSRDIGKDLTRYYFGLKSSLFTVQFTEGGEAEWVSWRDTARLVDMGILGAELLGTTYERILNEDRELTAIRITGAVYKLPPRVIFYGRGFGHGVGMSQWGAQGMALNGANYEQILKHYYQGIALTSIGGA